MSGRYEDAAPDAVLRAFLAASPFAQVLLLVGERGELVGVTATRAAHASGLLRVDDVAGRPLDELLRREPAASLRAGFRDSLRRAESTSYEDFVPIGGRETWWMTTLTPLLDDAGCPSRLLASFQELELLRAAESALRRTEASFRALVEAASDAILVSRRNGRVVHANPAAAALLGAPSARELVGRSIHEFVTTGDGSRLLAKRARGAACSTDALVTAIDGGAVEVAIQALPLVFDGQPAVLLLAVARSTEQRGALALQKRALAR